jgi:DNA-directed RNA polymerase specialized sigma subunit
MKIPLSQAEVAELASAATDHDLLARLLAACKLGDWEAKRQLARTFQPLLMMLATKRVGEDAALRNQMIERGREGLVRAAKRFPKGEPVRHFRVFALQFIETAMDHPPGFWQRLFGR